MNTLLAKKAITNTSYNKSQLGLKKISNINNNVNCHSSPAMDPIKYRSLPKNKTNRSPINRNRD